MGIVHNNLGDVYTLQGRQLAAQASNETNKAMAEALMNKAESKFEDAIAKFKLAIEDAGMTYAGEKQRHENATPQRRRGDAESEASSSTPQHHRQDNDPASASALSLQLANRKFNLALCLAAKGTSVVTLEGVRDQNAINDARRLMHGCERFAAERMDANGDQRRVECLLELARLERDQPNRHKEAAEALRAAEEVIINYRGTGEDGASGGRRTRGADRFVVNGIGVGDPERVALQAPLAALRQRLSVARAAHCVATGDPDAAIRHWTDAVIGCGNRMDISAIRTALAELRAQAKNKRGGLFPDALLVALELSPAEREHYGREPTELVSALDKALDKVDVEARKHGIVNFVPALATRKVDLCFVMDCTRSVRTVAQNCVWYRWRIKYFGTCGL